MHLESFITFLTHLPPRLGVTWASDSRPISIPSLPLNGIWQLRVSDLSVGLHTKSTFNTFVVQLYPNRVIFVGLSKTILVMASYDSGHPNSESYWAWVVPSESPYWNVLAGWLQRLLWPFYPCLRTVPSPSRNFWPAKTNGRPSGRLHSNAQVSIREKNIKCIK